MNLKKFKSMCMFVRIYCVSCVLLVVCVCIVVCFLFYIDLLVDGQVDDMFFGMIVDLDQFDWIGIDFSEVEDFDFFKFLCVLK